MRDGMVKRLFRCWADRVCVCVCVCVCSESGCRKERERRRRAGVGVGVGKQVDSQQVLTVGVRVVLCGGTWVLSSVLNAARCLGAAAAVRSQRQRMPD